MNSIPDDSPMYVLLKSELCVDPKFYDVTWEGDRSYWLSIMCICSRVTCTGGENEAIQQQ